MFPAVIPKSYSLSSPIFIFDEISIPTLNFVNPFTYLHFQHSLPSISVGNYFPFSSILLVLLSTHYMNENREDLAIFDPDGIKSSSLPFLKSEQPNPCLLSLFARPSIISLRGVPLMHLFNRCDSNKNRRGAIVLICIVNRHQIESKVNLHNY